MSYLFADRADAGQLLAERIRATGGLLPGSSAEQPLPLIVGLARGGVPVAREVAEAFDAPLDVLVVRKLGAPGQPEYAMGAIAAGQVFVADDVPRRLGVSDRQLHEIVMREDALRIERETKYRQERQPYSFAGRFVVLVDDGIATGATMAVAARAVRAAGAAGIMIAVPTAPRDALRRFADDPDIDRVVAVDVPEPFSAVGFSYRDFGQVPDDDVVSCLRDR
ncbi:phosphoribosyltransferase family protein [Gordonia sp. w5E2]|uniref:Phosphoribosyltransferase n=1 Tax=Gordonia jacobaea TaxID=122202 RepID=A0ABR5I8E5_9ACTN|nr:MULTISPECIES: phosphoribosyltransferase family protein [Gordonia]KNA89959.1 phosphoribosyltransferase [Gordonia jacobaea]